MNRVLHRALVPLATAGCAGALVVVACGGRTHDPNIPQCAFDDAGACHLPDGGVYAPGAGCVGIDTAMWSKMDPNSNWYAQRQVFTFPCDADSQCVFFPEGYAYGWSGCWHGPPGNPLEAGDWHCDMDFMKARVVCDPGPEGDQYCAALFQYVVSAPGAKAVARCVACPPNPETEICPGSCASGCATVGYVPFVKRGNAPPRCENPCQP